MLILLCSLLSCSSRKKHVEFSEEGKTEVERISLDSLKSETAKTETKKVTDKTIEQKKNEISGDIIIKGKTDSLQDFNFHNVVNGDTISDIYISGNADFIIKNRWKQIDKKEIKETVTEKLNIIATIARKSVAQKTIKEVAEKIKSKEVSVKSSGFQFPVYLIIGFAVLLLILLWFLWKKFGGGIMERINKLR